MSEDGGHKPRSDPTPTRRPLPEQRCRECGAPLTRAEILGYDGLCKTCSAKPQKRSTTTRSVVGLTASEAAAVLGAACALALK